MKLLIAILWASAAALVLFLVTQPIDLNTHLVTALVVAIIIAVLKMFRREGVLRAVVLSLGTIIVLRYVYWRTTSTIPPIEEPLNFVPGFILYLAEMYSVLMLFLSTFTIAEPMARPLRPVARHGDYPTVDVFVPTYNEDPALLATTLAAARQMDYPAERLNVYLLDDGGTDEKADHIDPRVATEARARRRELQQLARDLGVHYLTRARNTGAKAGNLNNGLAHSTGELVAVFDADHAPARDFLKNTVAHFEDDQRLFLVQTPHFFINPDPLEHNLGTWERMPSENEMFYGLIQRGMDKWNASFFCGSAAVLRRTALEEVGGFQGVSITEDCETAVDLHASGWRSVYVDRPMIAGLQPETFASFIGQRSRWAQGMMQIMLLKSPLFRSGLSMPQRLCYMSSMMFWLFPFARLIFLFSPLAYLFFGASIFDASGAEFAAYTATYIVINLLLQNYQFSRFRWPFISELYETIQSVYLVRALTSVIANPRKPSFRVTAKGETTSRSRVSELGWPFYVIFLILLLGVAATAWRLTYQPYTSDITLVVGGWNIFNLLLMGAALGVVAERRQLRRSQRVSIERPAEIIYGDRVIPARIDDVSISGARLIVPVNVLRGVKPGERIVMRFQPMAPLSGNELPVVVRSVMRDDTGLGLGCAFAVTEPRHHQLVSDLVFANSDEWVKFQAGRRKDIGVVRGTLEFIRLAIYETGRGIAYLFPKDDAVPPAPLERSEDGAGPALLHEPASSRRRGLKAVERDGERDGGGPSRGTAALRPAPVQPETR